MSGFTRVPAALTLDPEWLAGEIKLRGGGDVAHGRPPDARHVATTIRDWDVLSVLQAIGLPGDCQVFSVGGSGPHIGLTTVEHSAHRPSTFNGQKRR